MWGGKLIFTSTLIEIEIINTYDIETFPENEVVYPYCVCALIENKEIIVYYEENVDIILKSIKIISNNSIKDEITIFIHNINFDGSLILNSLSSNNIFFKIIIKELNLYSISFEYLGLKFIFKCSYKFIPLSLKSIALSEHKKNSFPYKFSDRKNLEYIGVCPNLNYFENENDYNYFKNEIFNFKKESINYCLNDVYLLKNVISNFVDTLNKINKKYIKFINNSYSIPSFSNKIFYNFFNKHKISKKISIELSTYISKSYFGGRCEIFGNMYNDEIIHFFDYSGMYAQCMLEKFPVGEPYFKLEIKKIEKSGFYYIKYKSNMDLPILPYKSNKLLFPNGNLEGIFWYEEILEFIKYGGEIISYEYAILYENEDYVFKEFINLFTELKNLGGYYKVIGKLIINSLYGSFGMKIDENFTIITFSEEEFNDIVENTNVDSYYKLNNCYVIKIKKDYKSKKLYNKSNKKWNDFYTERNVAYASIISSKARIKLYNSFNDVIKDGGRLLYCDTDSIFAAYKKNKLNKKCGKDILWSETYKEGLFVLPKTYILRNEKNEIIKFKGVNVKENNFEYFKEKLDEKEINFKNQLLFYKKNMVLKQKYIEKNVYTKNYDKRVMEDNMRKSRPLIISHTYRDV